MQAVDTEWVSIHSNQISYLTDLSNSISDFCTYKDYFVPIYVGRHLHILVAEG